MYDYDGYTPEQWEKLVRAVEDQRIINWQVVAVWASIVIISIAFWALFFWFVIIPLMGAWGGQ